MTAVEHRRFMTAGPKAPADARAFVRDRLSTRRRIDDLVLMVSELVTNAVRHGPPGQVFLRLIESKDSLRVEVQQLHETPTNLNGQKPRSGFGLKIVEALSDAWGTGDRDWAGVWFEIRNEGD
ncbi:MAG TPA: ATP-binding protein [Acidimicrobiia bacterium]|nr:ATP-binding protein [Acidimicrobiia bacterium]